VPFVTLFFQILPIKKDGKGPPGEVSLATARSVGEIVRQFFRRPENFILA